MVDHSRIYPVATVNAVRPFLAGNFGKSSLVHCCTVIGKLLFEGRVMLPAMLEYT